MSLGFHLNMVSWVPSLIGSLIGVKTRPSVLYGSFGICVSFIMFSYIFTNNGIRQVVSKLTSIHLDSTHEILKKSFFSQLIIASLPSITILILAPFLSTIFKDEYITNPLYIISATILIQSIVFIYTGILNGLKLFIYESLVGSVYSVLRPIFPLLFIMIIKRNQLIGSVIGLLFVSIITLVTAIIFTSTIEIKKRVKPISESIKKIIVQSLPFLTTFGIATIIRYFDLLSIKALLVDPSQAGYYSSASVISHLSYLFLLSFSTISFPYLAESVHNNDKQLVEEYIQNIFKYSLLLLLPIVAVVSLFSNNIVILVYGMEYAAAGPILKILIFGITILGLFTMLAQFVFITEIRKQVSIFLTICTGLFAIILDIILIKRFGIIGGAIATTSSGTIGFFLLLVVIKKHYSVITKNLIKIIIINITFYVLSWLSIKYLNIYYPYKLLVVFVELFVLYYVFDIIEKKDIIYFKKIIMKAVNKE